MSAEPPGRDGAHAIAAETPAEPPRDPQAAAAADPIGQRGLMP